MPKSRSYWKKRWIKTSHRCRQKLTRSLLKKNRSLRTSKRNKLPRKKRKWTLSIIILLKKRPKLLSNHLCNKLLNRRNKSLKGKNKKKSNHSFNRKIPLKLTSKKSSTKKRWNSSKKRRRSMKNNIKNKKLSKRGYCKQSFWMMRKKSKMSLIRDSDRKSRKFKQRARRTLQQKNSRFPNNSRRSLRKTQSKLNNH